MPRPAAGEKITNHFGVAGYRREFPASGEQRKNRPGWWSELDLGESRGASQPRALAEPDMSLSTHPAKVSLFGAGGNREGVGGGVWGCPEFVDTRVRLVLS